MKKKDRRFAIGSKPAHEISRAFGLTSALAVVVAALSIAPAADARFQRDSDSQPIELSTAQWSEQIWAHAIADRTTPTTVIEDWDRIPEDHPHKGVRDLRTGLDGFLGRLQAQLDERKTQYDESMSALEEHLRNSELSEALADAMAAHEAALSPTELAATQVDRGELPFNTAVIEDPRVENLIKQAQTAAAAAEIAGELFTAQELYYRLNELMNEDRRFQEDVERVSNRLAMIRFYDPAKFHSMNNEYLVAMGEDARPEYEDAPVTWRDHLRGIDREMVRAAISKAADRHLLQQGWRPLMVGGYDAMLTFISTDALSGEFPLLANSTALREFREHLQRSKAQWATKRDTDSWMVSAELRRLIEVSDRTVQLPAEVVLHEFAEGAMDSLDQFTDVIWPYDLEMFSRQLQGSFSGVGIQISLDEAGRLKVVSPLEDTPAHQAGLRAEDYITRIDDRSTVGISLQQAVDQITGPEGTMVELTIERSDSEEPITYRLERAEIELQSVKGWRRMGEHEWDYLIDPVRGIGYIRLTGFLEQTPEEFDRAVQEAKREAGSVGLRGLILDLRFNPGGQLTASVEIANRFVADGVIVSTEGGRASIPRHQRARRSRAAALEGVQVTVLINQGSASASEIVSGCLKDHDRAVIVGERSYGKGSVQKIEAISSGEALLKLTSEYYVLPKGGIIHREVESTTWGVDPHLLVRMTPKRVVDTLKVRQNADVLLDPSVQLTDEERAERDPARLLTEPLDLQLQTGLLMLQSRLLESFAESAMLVDVGR